MTWLEAGAALIVAALVMVRWLGSHMCLIWRYPQGRRETVTATMVRPMPQRVIRGDIEPPPPA